MRRQLFDSEPHLQLTPRETIVLSAARKYEPVGTIANSLQIPQSIVLRHLANITKKLNMSDEKLAHQLVFTYDLPNRNITP